MLLGAPGVCYWDIEAVRVQLPGSDDLYFDAWYGRSWEGRDSAEKEFTIPIHVVPEDLPNGPNGHPHN